MIELKIKIQDKFLSFLKLSMMSKKKYILEITVKRKIRICFNKKMYFKIVKLWKIYIKCYNKIKYKINNKINNF